MKKLMERKKRHDKDPNHSVLTAPSGLERYI